MDGLSQYLDALEREERYRVDDVLKSSEFETTQRVVLQDDGGDRGPYIRKVITRDSGLGSVYELVYQACQQGRHFKHIPAVVECYQRDQATVVVMEYIEGPTLADYVYEHDPSLQLASDIFPQLCDAVTELHTQFSPPIIHRDLKPSNIIIRDGVPVIIDLGIARERKEQAETDTTHFGTRAYAPPEQFGYGQTTERSDVYALGMLLYFMLVEQTPSMKVVRRGFEDVRIPEPVRRTIVCATSFDPQQRYATALELKQAFALALVQEGAEHIANAAQANGQQAPAASVVIQPQIPEEQLPPPVPAPPAPASNVVVQVQEPAPSFFAGVSQPVPTAADKAAAEAAELKALQEQPLLRRFGVRNCIIVLAWALLSAFSIWTGVHPEMLAPYRWPVAFEMFMNIVMMPVFLAILAFLPMNKKRLHACVGLPHFLQGAKGYAVWFGAFVGILAFAQILGYIVGPA